MIYFYIYLILGLISAFIVSYDDYINGRNLTIQNFLHNLWIILLWPGVWIAIGGSWYEENKYKILIKGKKK